MSSPLKDSCRLIGFPDYREPAQRLAKAAYRSAGWIQEFINVTRRTSYRQLERDFREHLSLQH